MVQESSSDAQQKPGAVPVHAHNMERIRKVFDEHEMGRKQNAITTPREDAQMTLSKNAERKAVPCECIIELYELLWRWGHRNTNAKGFAEHFGFAIPDTIVIVKGKPYAWYFISKTDGSLLRKKEENLSLGAVEKKFTREGSDTENSGMVCAFWLPMASQFPEARCHSPHAEFLSHNGFRRFLAGLRSSHSGILQAFIEPHGVSNFLVRTVQYWKQTSLCVRTNRSILKASKTNIFERAATFEGWAGLSSSSSRYRNHKHPHMESLLLSAGATLSSRIEQERVRQMLFLGPTQHVALHFKVSKDNMLYFIYASVVQEKDVILQMRPQLLMGDTCMTEELEGAALLPGGTEKKAPPNKAPVAARPKRREEKEHWSYASYNEGGQEGFPLLEEGEEEQDHTGRRMQQRDGWERSERSERSTSLPPLAHLSARRRLPLPVHTVLPRMDYPRPEVPLPPFQATLLPHRLDEAGRYEYAPPFVFDRDPVKRPLIAPNTARSEPAPSPSRWADGAQTHRSISQTARDERYNSAGGDTGVLGGTAAFARVTRDVPTY